jgi:hypothetical protein
MFGSAGLGRSAFHQPPCPRPEAQSFVKSEIVMTEAGDREEEGLVKEKVEAVPEWQDIVTAQKIKEIHRVKYTSLYKFQVCGVFYSVYFFYFLRSGDGQSGLEKGAPQHLHQLNRSLPTAGKISALTAPTHQRMATGAAKALVRRHRGSYHGTAIQPPPHPRYPVPPPQHTNDN